MVTVIINLVLRTVLKTAESFSLSECIHKKKKSVVGVVVVCCMILAKLIIMLITMIYQCTQFWNKPVLIFYSSYTTGS